MIASGCYSFYRYVHGKHEKYYFNPTFMAGDADIKKSDDKSDDGDKGADKKDQKDDSGSKGDDDSGGDGDDKKKKVDTVPHKTFHAEREMRKAAQKELKEFKDAKEARSLKAKEKKGEFEKLYNERKTSNDDLTKQVKDLTSKITGFTEAAQTRLDSSISSIKSEDDRKMVKELLEPHPLEKRESLLPGILEKFSLPSSVHKRVDGDGGGKEDSAAKRQEAKENGNPLAAIQNAKVVETTN